MASTTTHHGTVHPSTTPFKPAFEKALNHELSQEDNSAPPPAWHADLPASHTWRSAGVRLPLPALALILLLLLLETSIITFYTAVALWATLPLRTGQAPSSQEIYHQPPQLVTVVQTSVLTSTSLVTSVSTMPASTVTLNVTVTATPSLITPVIEFSTVQSTTEVPASGAAAKPLR